MPKLHKKPTIKELSESIDSSLTEIEKKDPEVPEVPPETVVPETKEDTTETTETPETKEEKPPEEEKSEVTETPETTEDPQKEKKVDYKKRYVDSSAESQILYAKNKKMAEAIDKAGDVTEPTEEELRKYVTDKGTDWDEMSAFEQSMAKDNLMTKRSLDAIREAGREFKELDVWNGKVDAYITDPETLVAHPELEGKEDDFRVFVMKPTRQGVDFDDLVSSFLYANSQNKPEKKKGAMFETGTGGSKEKPKPTNGKISVEESMRLRISNYKLYQEKLRAGQIEEAPLA